MSEKNDQSFSKALWDSILKTAKHFNTLTAPQPSDNNIVRLGKYVGRIFGIIASILLSPLVALALLLAFLAAI